MIEARLASEEGVPFLDAPILTRARHQVAVSEASAQVKEFVKAWQEDDCRRL